MPADLGQHPVRGGDPHLYRRQRQRQCGGLPETGQPFVRQHVEDFILGIPNFKGQSPRPSLAVSQKVPSHEPDAVLRGSGMGPRSAQGLGDVPREAGARARRPSDERRHRGDFEPRVELEHGRPPGHQGARAGAVRGEEGRGRPGPHDRAALRLCPGPGALPPGGRTGPGQDPGRRDAGPHGRRRLRPAAVHPRPGAGRHRRHPHLQGVDRGLRDRAGPDLRQHRPGRRDQPGAGQGAVGPPRGHGRAARVDRRDDVPGAGPVHGHGHPEPHRERGRLPPPRGPAGPVPDEDPGRLPERPGGGRDRAAHERRPAGGPAGAGPGRADRPPGGRRRRLHPRRHRRLRRPPRAGHPGPGGRSGSRRRGRGDTPQSPRATASPTWSG